MRLQRQKNKPCMDGTASRLLVRGKIRLLKVDHPKFEAHVTPNEDEHQIPEEI